MAEQRRHKPYVPTIKYEVVGNKILPIKPHKAKVIKQVEQRKKPQKLKGVEGLDLQEKLQRLKDMGKSGSIIKEAWLPLIPLVGAGIGALGGAATAPKGHRASGALMGGAFGALSGGVGSGAWAGGKALAAGAGRASAGKAFQSGVGSVGRNAMLKGVATDTALTTGLNAMTGAYRPQGQGQPGYTGQFANPSMPIVKTSSEDNIYSPTSENTDRDLYASDLFAPGHERRAVLNRNALKRSAMTAGTLGLAGVGRRLAQSRLAQGASSLKRHGVGLAGLLAGASIIPAAYAINKKTSK